eukprot:COSAG02_NODE_62_length_43372_cov_14.404710_14_plen_62_part_00
MYCVEKNTRNASAARKARAERRPVIGRHEKPCDEHTHTTACNESAASGQVTATATELAVEG